MIGLEIRRSSLDSDKSSLEPVGEFRRRPESEPFFCLAKTAKQAIFVLSSMQPVTEPCEERAARNQIEFSDRALHVGVDHAELLLKS
jgi:hypothetical protein